MDNVPVSKDIVPVSNLHPVYVSPTFFVSTRCIYYNHHAENKDCELMVLRTGLFYAKKLFLLRIAELSV